MSKSVIAVNIDAQIFVFQRHGGVSRYFVQLASAFADPALGIKARLPFWLSSNEHLLAARLGRFWHPPGAEHHPRLMLLANKLLPRRLGSPHLVHSTYYFSSNLRMYRGLPLVVTIYDMIPELFPDAFPEGNPHMGKAEYVQRADAIICLSESTRNDLVSLWGIDPARTTVVHLGVETRDGVCRATTVNGIPENYVLFVGPRKAYKNFRTLAEAFAIVSRSQTDLALLCVGGGKFLAEESLHFQELGITNRVHWTAASDAQLKFLYRKARVFVFPSLYEGFGLPLLEAMAQNCPVIAARTSSLPEICDEAAEYCDPRSADSMAAALSRVVSDGGRRQKLINLGGLRCRDFTWRRTAEKTAAVYRSLVNG